VAQRQQLPQTAKWLQVVMRDPKRVYLCAAGLRGNMVCECVERESRVSDILALLEAHGLVAAMARDCTVVGKHHDGSTVGRVAIALEDSIADIEARLSAALVCTSFH
jgi:hypothetical protein